MLQRNEVVEQLQKFIAEQVLDGKNIGLDETTPLLEWGVINSLEIVRLLNFIREQFDIDITPDQMIADNFVDIGVITDLVLLTEQETLTSTLDSVR
jgi:acyl carrier protein